MIEWQMAIAYLNQTMKVSSYKFYKMQRSHTISLLAIFLHIFLYFTSLAFSQPTITSPLDVDGNQLQVDTKYYIFPLHRGGGGGGGLALSLRDPLHPCPPNVLQENNDASIGLSVKIFPVQEAIHLSTDVNIAFMAATTCVQRTVWRIVGVDGMTGRRYVRSGGALGRPGAETVGNWFKIEKSGGEGYKMVYCPSVCSTCEVSCGDVGVFVENGKRWLGVGGLPLVVVFKKVV